MISQVLRKRVECLPLSLSRHLQSAARPTRSIPPLAFVFDIDGVLIQGKHVLSEAKRAISLLEGNNRWKQKIPYVLLTNGGGVSESERSQKLSEQLETPIHPNQVIQAHTILKSIVSTYADKPILVLGGRNDTVRQVATSYGFKRAYTTLDVHAWNPSVWPFHKLSKEEKLSTQTVDFLKTPIEAIIVFHDPRNWSLDIQIMCDAILSGGIIGGPAIPRHELKRRPVEVIFCNPDLIWRSEFNQPRLGQGAFKDAFLAVFKSLAGYDYEYIQYGKPTVATHRFAETVLLERLEELYGVRSLPSVYMIGDNPESDIKGALAASWHSVLVRTGVYNPENGAPKHRPTWEAEHVEEAVTWALEREYGGLKRD